MPSFTKIEDYQIKENAKIGVLIEAYKTMLKEYKGKEIKETLEFVNENKFVEMYRESERDEINKADTEYKDEIKNVKKDGKTWESEQKKLEGQSDVSKFVAAENALKASIIKAAKAYNDLIDKMEVLTDDDDWDKILKADEDSRLGKSVSRTKWEGWRDEVVELLDIRDTTHSGHGSNFSGSQNLKQVIENLMEKVNDSKHPECAKKLYIEYGYVLYG